MSLDDISQLLHSKTLVLEQLDAEFKEIAAQVQDAKKRQTTKSTGTKTTKKGTKKTKAAAKQVEPEEVETSEVEVKGPDYLAQATEAVLTAGNFVMEKRAYLLFGVTAALIHFYGDYASV